MSRLSDEALQEALRDLRRLAPMTCQVKAKSEVSEEEVSAADEEEMRACQVQWAEEGMKVRREQLKVDVGAAKAHQERMAAHRYVGGAIGVANEPEWSPPGAYGTVCPMMCGVCGAMFNAAGWPMGKRFVCGECEGKARNVS